MSDYLDVIHKEVERLMNISYECESLSRAFYATGNTVMGENMRFIADDLMSAKEEISGAVHKNVNERYQEAQQGTANMINACLAMGRVNDD